MEQLFDIDKAVASAAYLAKRCGGKIGIFVLIKMMYAAEREALARWNRSITGDSFASLRKGPILSRTYNLIKGEVSAANSDMEKWSQHFSPREGNQVRLIAEPDFDFLSDRELEALEKAAKEIEVLIQTHGQIADILHSRWPEWKDPAGSGGGAIDLPVQAILEQVVEDEREVEEIMADIKAVNSAKALLQVNQP